jgi:hypothetical protein
MGGGNGSSQHSLRSVEMTEDLHINCRVVLREGWGLCAGQSKPLMRSVEGTNFIHSLGG